MEITRLTQDDWDDLIPETAVQLGKTTLIIRPLGIKDLKTVGVKVKAIFAGLDDEVIDFDTDEGLSKLFVLALDKAPDILEMCSGLHRDDIAALPIASAVALFRAVLEANISSRESLVKNFVALGEIIKRLTPAAKA